MPRTVAVRMALFHPPYFEPVSAFFSASASSGWPAPIGVRKASTVSSDEAGAYPSPPSGLATDAAEIDET